MCTPKCIYLKQKSIGEIIIDDYGVKYQKQEFTCTYDFKIIKSWNRQCPKGNKYGKEL